MRVGKTTDFKKPKIVIKVSYQFKFVYFKSYYVATHIFNAYI
jgi:hypothetical protein